mmetsp:Transcript_2951/g.4464  ORF Transcript_2951/g.4464 Transcript_2951/m.4464 type:complete len:184 (+) Transcript_2951:39-590(+)
MNTFLAVSLIIFSFFSGAVAYSKLYSPPKSATPLLASSSRELLKSGSDDEDEEVEIEKIKDWTLSDGPFKLVLIVNTELGMQKGKIAAQCCHATLACYKIAKKYAPSCLKGWEFTGQTKICVKCPTEAELWSIKEKAEAAGLVNYLVMDAGRTQIASGSRTVLGLGPAPEMSFLGISDHLKLM